MAFQALPSPKCETHRSPSVHEGLAKRWSRLATASCGMASRLIASCST